MIKKASNITFENKKLSVIIAGVPGIGKTTLALSSPKPLLIDLDNGISRVEARYRKDTDIVNSYDELKQDLTESDLSDYETIVIDTGGKLLELLKPVVINEDRKNGKKDGSLSLQGYGAVKRKFAEFVSFVKSLNKNLIIVFHASEVDVGNDTTGLRIRIEGGSKDEIWDDIDIGGFIEMNGNKRTIGFSNCDRYYAKGTHGVHGIYEIPTLEKGMKNDFLTKMFDKIKEDLNNEVDEFNKYNETMNLRVDVENAKTVDELNNAFEKIKNANHYLTSKEELWAIVNNKAKEIGASYASNEKCFK